MATNPYVNKVVKNGQTVIDLTADTVTPADVAAGVTFHDASGAACVGTGSGGGKTVASVAPTTVPVGYTNVVATYETVSYDVTTLDTVNVREYEVSFGTVQVDTLDADAYGVDLAQADRPNAQMASADPRLNGVAPGGVVGTQGTLKTTTSRSGTDAEVAAWLAGFRAFYGGSINLYPAKTNASPSSYTLTSTSGNFPRAIETDEDGTITVTRMDGTEQTQAAPADTEVDYSEYGNEALASARCKSATGTAVYGPGYLVTYTDNTTETFVAASSDIAEGSY